MDAISTVQRVVATRSADKLDGILLVADQELVLTGYDSELVLNTEWKPIYRKGDIVFPQVFMEVVRKLPDNHVYLEVQEDNILIVEAATMNSVCADILPISILKFASSKNRE